MDAAWRSYAEQVAAADAGATQRMECRRAFYAGAVAFKGALIASGGHDEITALQPELTEFNDSAKRGEA